MEEDAQDADPFTEPVTRMDCARLDRSRPISILATKDEASLRALLPEFWERKGAVHPVGIFVRGEDRNYIALRNDVVRYIMQ